MAKSLLVGAFLVLIASASVGQSCPCDCNGDGVVRVNEVTTAVGISLARFGTERCPAADVNGSGGVEINELVAGVNAALFGCPAESRPTPTPNANFTAAELAAARELWRDQGLSHYRYRYTLGCFCLGPRDVRIEVFDERFADFRHPEDGRPLEAPAYLDLYFTIDGLFDYLARILTSADRIEASFDPVQGYPTNVFIDHYLAAIDDELWIEIRDVEPLAMAGVCRTANDCDVSFEVCIAPGGFAGCGICIGHQAECEIDGDCERENICDPIGYDADTCACDPTVRVCKPGCDGPSDCPAGQTCGLDRHCTPIACDGNAASCPAAFTCVLPIESGLGECRRTACADDTPCGERTGFCVNHECHLQPGRCDIVPP